jgi:hypothetical protein
MPSSAVIFGTSWRAIDFGFIPSSAPYSNSEHHIALLSDALGAIMRGVVHARELPRALALKVGKPVVRQRHLSLLELNSTGDLENNNRTKQPPC